MYLKNVNLEDNLYKYNKMCHTQFIVYVDIGDAETLLKNTWTTLVNVIKEECSVVK